MKNLLLIFTFQMITYLCCNCQINDFGMAKDYSLIDLNHQVHYINSSNENQKSYILNFSAAWCGISWAYRNNEDLQSIYKKYGPKGSKELEILLIENDPTTKLDCLYGTVNCNGGTMGDWANSTFCPVVHAESQQFDELRLFNITLYPSIFLISPDRQVINLGMASQEKIESYLLHSFKLNAEANFYKPSCKNNGSIKLNVSGGYKSKTFRWSSGATSPNLENLSPGNYQVTITDENLYSRAFAFQLDGLAPLTINDQRIKNLTCYNDQSGAIELIATGGRSQLTYKWSNGARQPAINKLSAGLYTAVVSDIDGCSIAESFIVKQPDSLVSMILLSPSNCNVPSGSISIKTAGGWGNYQYRLDNGLSQVVNNYIDLPKGSYKLTIQDQQLCKVIKEIIIENKPSPHYSISTLGTLNCINDDSVKIKLNKLNNQDKLNIRWLDSADRVVGIEETFNIKYPGAYYLKVTNIETGCSKDTVIQVNKSEVKPELVIKEKIDVNGHKFSFEGSNYNIVYWQIGEKKIKEDTLVLHPQESPPIYFNLIASNFCHELILKDTLEGIPIDLIRNGDDSSSINVKQNQLIDSINELKILPSPAVKNITLNAVFKSLTTGTLLIENSTGMELVKEHFNLQKMEKSFDVSDWLPGIYYVRIVGDELSLVKMFLVVR